MIYAVIFLALTCFAFTLVINTMVPAETQAEPQTLLSISSLSSEFSKKPCFKLYSNVVAIGGEYVWMYYPVTNRLLCYTIKNDEQVLHDSIQVDIVPSEIFCNTMGSRVYLLEEDQTYIPGTREELRSFLCEESPLDLTEVRVYSCTPSKKSRIFYLLVFLLVPMAVLQGLRISDILPDSASNILTIIIFTLFSLLLIIFYFNPLHTAVCLNSPTNDPFVEHHEDFSSSTRVPYIFNKIPRLIMLRSFFSYFTTSCCLKKKMFCLKCRVFKSIDPQKRPLFTCDLNTVATIEGNTKKGYELEYLDPI